MNLANMVVPADVETGACAPRCGTCGGNLLTVVWSVRTGQRLTGADEFQWPMPIQGVRG